ncbi:MAG: DUF1616 domain-containing protein [Promethearchaeota archaeon]
MPAKKASLQKVPNDDVSAQRKEKISRKILYFQNKIQIIHQEIKKQLEDLTPPNDITTYLRHPIYGAEFLIVVVSTYIAIISALLIPADAGLLSFIRIFFGLALVLFLPGWSCTALLFSPHSSDVDFIERIALSFGLSLAISIIDGLLLNEFWSLALEPILITLSFITLSMMVLAIFIRTSGKKEKTK